MKYDPDSSHNRILIIDDNPEIHQDFRKILGLTAPDASGLDDLLADVFGEAPARAAKLDFVIDSAYQGQEGLAMVEAAHREGRPYALAFVDMRMPPGWDGVETISRIWAEDASIQIVICTAYSDYSWQDIVTRLGNSDRLVILKKPFDSVEVLQLAHAMSRKWLVTLRAGRKMEELHQLVDAQTRELQDSNHRLRVEMEQGEVAREALKISEERLSQAFAACPMPIAILRLQDHVCVEVNPACLEATGRDRDALLSQPLWICGIRISPKALLDIMAEVAHGRPVAREECLIVREGGAPRPALLWMEPFAMASGPHLLAVVQDVGEQQLLEQQLRQSQKMEAVGQLAAGVAHDLNNLLTVILGHASVQMLRDDLDGDMEGSLTQVQEAGERAAALTRQLLAFSRKQVMQKRVVSVTAVVSNVEAMLRRLIPENIQFCFDLAATLPCVLADVCNLEQVIVNLVINARDAMPEGGTLTIHTGTAVRTGREISPHQGKAGEYVTLSVADTGTGMSEETRAQIFEPFFTTKEVGKGTGMGLATVMGIVQQHDGWIEVSSEPGAGSTFTVWLPVTQRLELPGTEPQPRAARTPGSQRVILLVEDDENVRRLARGVLRSGGYEVLEAQDGRAGVELWRSHPGRIDLLLTDMVMPGGLSGKDVAQRFSAERPDAGVLFSSGYSVDLFRDDLNLEEGRNYLPKPYLAQQLLDAVGLASDDTAGLVRHRTAEPHLRVLGA